MKNILLTLSLLAPVAVVAQTTSSATPFKGANVIMIQTTDKANTALRILGAQLVAKGYTVKAMDSTFHTLTTEPKNLTGYLMPMAISVRAVGVEGGLRLTAENAIQPNAMTGVQTVVQPVVFANNKTKGPLAEIIQAAQAYPGGVVTFKKE